MLNCNFGEVIEPVSRAFYDDFDDENLNQTYRCPSWKWLENEEKYPEKLKNLIIIEGNNALNTINDPILSKRSPVCQADQLKISVFDLPENDTVIVTSEEKDLNYFNAGCQLLQKWLNIAENVIGFTILPKAEFKGTKTIDSSFIRGINSKFEDVHPLEVPNFITGLVAAAASYRKFKDTPFSCYIFYLESFDVLTIKEILKFLKRLELPCNDSAKIRPLTQDSNLYS